MTINYRQSGLKHSRLTNSFLQRRPRQTCGKDRERHSQTQPHLLGSNTWPDYPTQIQRRIIDQAARDSMLSRKICPYHQLNCLEISIQISPTVDLLEGG